MLVPPLMLGAGEAQLLILQGRLILVQLLFGGGQARLGGGQLLARLGARSSPASARLRSVIPVSASCSS